VPQLNPPFLQPEGCAPTGINNRFQQNSHAVDRWALLQAIRFPAVS
jgi:hypothetical protein